MDRLLVLSVSNARSARVSALVTAKVVANMLVLEVSMFCVVL